MIRKSKRKIVISKALPRVHTVVDSAPSEPVEPVVSEPAPSSSAAAAKEPRVGDNLRILRMERGLSLAELSERSEVSKAMLSQIEMGRSSPTIALGWKIANGLGVPFGALLGEPMPGDFVIHRSEQAQILYSEGKTLCSRALFPAGDPRVAEMYELTLEPGMEERASAHIPGTREQLYVTAGQLLVEAAGHEATLQAGDVLFFCSDRPHRYHNPGHEPVRCILLMLYPKDRKPTLETGIVKV
jgi:transcriptional regulator with XRE-family HTH domain